MRYIPAALKVIHQENRKATVKDFEELHSQGYLLISDVNYYALRQESGYSSHAVLMYGFDNKQFYLHDPELPPKKGLQVNKKIFQEAGGDNLSAFKLND